MESPRVLAYFALIMVRLGRLAENCTTNSLTFLLNYRILGEQCAVYTGEQWFLGSCIYFCSICACYHLHVVFFKSLAYTGLGLLCGPATVSALKIPLMITPPLSVLLYVAKENHFALF